MLEKNRQAIYDYNRERGLTTFNKEKEIGFLIEEVDEFFKAETDLERVDALCDIIVFAVGQGFKQNDESPLIWSDCDGRPIEDDRTVASSPVTVTEAVNILTANWQLIVHRVELLLLSMGYDNNKCIEETIKHISSRKGEIDKVTGKFMKYTDEQHMSEWYEPNYELCKLVDDNDN